MSPAKLKTLLRIACAVAAISAGALTAAPAMSQPASAAAQRAVKYYELRTYYAAPGKLKDVQNEFTAWIIPALDRAGMTPIAYWNKEGPGDGAVVYLLGWSDKEDHDAGWARFIADPQTRQSMTAANAGSADGVRAIARTEISFMSLADFSPHPRTAEGLPLR